MTRRLEFATTEAVELARRRDRFIPGPVCGSSQQRYLFHRTGARFVRCRACDLVYADPVDTSARGYFDIAALGPNADTIDHDHLVADFTSLLGDLADSYETRTGRRPCFVLVLGRWHHDFVSASDDLRIELAAEIVEDEQTLLTKPLAQTLGADLGASTSCC